MTTGPLLSSEPLALLTRAYEEEAQKEGVEWILLSSLGTALKQVDAPFSPAVYGYKDLLTFVKAYPERFETRRQASKGKPVLIRQKHAPAPAQPSMPPSPAKATTASLPKRRKKAASPSFPTPTTTPMLVKILPPRDASLTTLLIEAYRHAAEQLQEQWVPIPHFGAALKRLDPQFQAKVYGYKDLPTLVRSRTDLFLTRKQTTGKTKHVEVWLVTGK
jgi:OST-HTH/LOTUS domain